MAGRTEQTDAMNVRMPAWLGISAWLPHYNRTDAAADGMAALIVTIMLIPQSLAYAMLAGLPPQIGLYASILPLIIYALFGSSRTLSVGPVAVLSLMTFTAAGQVAPPGSAEYIAACIALAMLSGVMLLAMGVMKLGWLSSLLSHPVISGFITASGILIAASQLKHLLGIPLQGHTLWGIGVSMSQQWQHLHLPTVLIGISALVFLFWVRKWLKPLLLKLKCSPFLADLISKAGPVLAVVATTAVTAHFALDSKGLAVVGDVPAGLPDIRAPIVDLALWQQLLVPALLITLVGFVESVSVAQALAAKRRQRIDPNQELRGLGAANVASAFSGGFPVTGGFARSVVNFDAGARTPLAGAMTAIGIALAALFLTPLFFYLPNATLAATIIVAVLTLVDFGVLKHTWHYAKADFFAALITMAGVLFVGIEAGITAGVLLSIILFLWRTSQPHVAEVGRVPGTEHFRNVQRHDVEKVSHILAMRVDESLYFANARRLEDQIYDAAVLRPHTRDVILMCSAINHLDASAIDSLMSLNQRLMDAGIRFHLSEVKGPVMDQLSRTDLPSALTGQVFMSQSLAMDTLSDRHHNGTASTQKEPQ